jgi:hypothetical protein
MDELQKEKRLENHRKRIEATHDKDMIDHPDRHFINKSTYPRYEWKHLCYACLAHEVGKYEYDARTDAYIRVRK